MLFLSGGTGTPKLLQGVRKFMPDEDITVIVNTAEDTWVSGNLVCPDIDTLLYLFSGLIDDDRWWGVKGDTYHTHDALAGFGCREGMMIGDVDRATHVLRSSLLREGKSLSEAIEVLGLRMGVRARVLPMSNDPLATMIMTDVGLIHFQDFWVVKRGSPRVDCVVIEGMDRASATDEVVDAIKSSDSVVIGPSNPVTSIGPILRLRGVRSLLRERFVLGVSPIVGCEPVSGPAGKLLSSEGYSVSSCGVAEYYGDILDLFVVDLRDGASPGEFDIPVVVADTLMTSVDKSMKLGEMIIHELNRNI
ncbi:2-phospho-L-lactate transferase [Methanosarcinales archaeon ex4572_44]|nr:MAG: 2-phospho-L-lactate transferase [Methanosarcinales archaeon ex4572_44]